MKGQAFTTFKILIGAVFAIALLIIVYSVTSQQQTPFSGFEEARDLVLQASRAPDNCFSRSKVTFSAGEAVPESYFGGFDMTVEWPDNFDPVFAKSGSVYTVKKSVETYVSAKCSPDNKCNLYFGSAVCLIP